MYFPKTEIFLRKKMGENRKLPTETEFRATVQRGELRFPPLELDSFEFEGSQDKRRREPDALLTFRWQQRSYRFVVEYKQLSTPKSVDTAVHEARGYVCDPGVLPMVVVPFLNGEQLAKLESQAVSGLDLCGNGVVVVPGQLLVYRTGNPNRFPAEGTIKNVYRRSSSIVARAFLLVPRFDSVRDLMAEIRKRGGTVTMATVSKVCTGLDEDLVIQRSSPGPKREKQMRLLQPEKLLDLLVANNTPPTIDRTFAGKCTLAQGDLVRTLEQWAKETGNRVAQTGSSSVEAYAVMAREPVRKFYCTNLKGVIGALGETVRETDRFENVILYETADEFVYFDSRDGLVASPIQVYLELSSGDKRDRETAEQVRRVILGSIDVEGVG